MCIFSLGKFIIGWKFLCEEIGMVKCSFSILKYTINSSMLLEMHKQMYWIRASL